MYESAYNRLFKKCPCLECIVKMICINRYKNCSLFREFIDDGIVVKTQEAMEEEYKLMFK